MQESHTPMLRTLLPEDAVVGPRAPAAPGGPHVAARDGRLVYTQNRVFGDREVGAYLLLLRLVDGAWQVLTLTYGPNAAHPERAGSFDIPGGKVDRADCSGAALGEFPDWAGRCAAQREFREEVGFPELVPVRYRADLWLDSSSGAWSYAYAALGEVAADAPDPTEWEGRYASAQWTPLAAALESAERARQADRGKFDVPALLRAAKQWCAAHAAH